MTENCSSLAQTPVTTLKGVGVKIAQCLEKLHIHTVDDLVFHLPHRYEDRTRIYPLKDVKTGMVVNIEGEIARVKTGFGKKRSMIVEVVDGYFTLECRFFHFSGAQKSRLKPGTLIRCFGEVRRFGGKFSMIHPEYALLDDDLIVPVADTLTPVYPLADGIKQKGMRNLCAMALEQLGEKNVQELLPEAFRQHLGEWTLRDALLFLHAPSPDVSIDTLESATHPAMIRLIFEELVAYLLSMEQLRQTAQLKKAFPIMADEDKEQALLAQLDFMPTGAQSRAIADIKQDLQQNRPMQRLVQGDVGSGKTLVAAFAALAAISAGHQVALMVPTEILAEQHFEWFSQYFSALGIRCELLTSNMKAKEKRSVLENTQLGLSQLVVGTHSLFQQQVLFKNLALIIIDEQHRFGVHQRFALKMKGLEGDSEPHQLIMTATPIPRTLSMTAYANLDKSIIDELPPGRTPVKTVALPDKRRDEIIDKVLQATREGRQVYWVCTLIDESELIQSQAAEKAQEALQAALGDIAVGLVHGRLKPEEKQCIMQQFKAGELAVLVATTVIEVGVNVPNASLMVIENPERLGLAQLHQLRGRVGRGSVESHCILLYHGPLSKNAKARLAAMRETNDGFVIAERDLEIRGPGEILGTRQTGGIGFRVADIFRDQQLLVQARTVAKAISREYPDKAGPLMERWIGHKAQYGDA